MKPTDAQKLRELEARVLQFLTGLSVSNSPAFTVAEARRVLGGAK